MENNVVELPVVEINPPKHFTDIEVEEIKKGFIVTIPPMQPERLTVAQRFDLSEYVAKLGGTLHSLSHEIRMHGLFKAK